MAMFAIPENDSLVFLFDVRGVYVNICSFRTHKRERWRQVTTLPPTPYMQNLCNTSTVCTVALLRI